MPARTSDEKGVCLSVKRVHCDKTEERSVQGRSWSFKVTDFVTNRKPIYDLLSVINTNLPPILYRFQVMADCQIFASDRRALHFKAIAGGNPLRISP